MDPNKPKLGRPPTGNALSSTERNRRLRAKAAHDGRRVLGSVMLTAEASASLERLTSSGATISEAVSEALILAGTHT